MKTLWNRFLRWLWLIEPQQQAGDITLQGAEGELKVSIGKFTDWTNWQQPKLKYTRRMKKKIKHLVNDY